MQITLDPRSHLLSAPRLACREPTWSESSRRSLSCRVPGGNSASLRDVVVAHLTDRVQKPTRGVIDLLRKIIQHGVALGRHRTGHRVTTTRHAPAAPVSNSR